MVSDSLPSPSPLHTRVARVRHWLLYTATGRVIVLALAMRLAALLLGALPGLDRFASVLGTAGSMGIAAGVIAGLAQLSTTARHVLLWRVRRKLLISYVFIGVVPLLLVITFFSVCGLLLFFNIGSYLMRTRLETLASELSATAQATAEDLARARNDVEARDELVRHQARTAARYPGASFAAVSDDRTCEAASRAPVLAGRGAIAAGAWPHLTAPTAIPAWVPCEGRAGVLAYLEGPDGRTRLAVRAIALSTSRVAGVAVVVDLPLDEALEGRLRVDTGVQIRSLIPLDESPADVSPVEGLPAAAAAAPADETLRIRAGPVQVLLEGESRGALEWATLLDFTDWASGQTGTLGVTFRMSPLDAYQRISSTSLARLSNLTFGQVVLILLAVLGSLFLVIQGAALLMGIALARSITGAVHELFVGTERVRRGDFTHPIAVRSRDQLGELAASFNSMTASIEDLLVQKAEKDRLEQELRIARGIQMSLLPQGPLGMPGAALVGHCEPAREVGGDYYDVLPISDRRFGLLIADVAGKGTSAALYMAELKGIVHSLSHSHHSPRQLLIDADRIISRHLASNSFITMTYAVVDLDARTFTYARAGHCPLIHVPGPGSPSRAPSILVPDGLVLGLQLDEGVTFDRLLEESTVPFGPGDLFFLFTDGLSEAMNADGECFGETRLGDVLCACAEGPFAEIGARLLGHVRSFVGPVAQQDDMTMLILQVGDAGVPVQ